MAKKKLDKEAESTPSSPSKIVAVCKNETVHFVIGLMLVIFSVYLLLAFSSFLLHLGHCINTHLIHQIPYINHRPIILASIFYDSCQVAIL